MGENYSLFNLQVVIKTLSGVCAACDYHVGLSFLLTSKCLLPELLPQTWISSSINAGNLNQLGMGYHFATASPPSHPCPNFSK